MKLNSHGKLLSFHANAMVMVVAVMVLVPAVVVTMVVVAARGVGVGGYIGGCSDDRGGGAAMVWKRKKISASFGLLSIDHDFLPHVTSNTGNCGKPFLEKKNSVKKT
jgi:hypothetical protein